MSIKLIVAIFGTLALLSTGVAQAQMPPPAANPPAATKTNPPAAATKAKPARTAKSLECSKKADEQKLHGKPRKKFMSDCKKA